MATFVIEVYRAGLTRRSLEDLARAVRGSIRGGAATGTAAADGVRYLGCTLAPDDEVGYIRIASGSRSLVDALVAGLGLGDARVTEVVDLG